ncbi:AraC family transcriptional regulator [Solimonas sp. K1W22B-7]|uniref:AraC family transcriptional regulator n=1 Tax=Solimonas sp. K1W22B-7 TaxID=2303331 RepID=UPI000E337B75|nr:AraC family transcriptional regulator [Solimonas sp. K1W22B-7]AXQ29813.1 AraC family transcriptional regulator [Solimonas sp. K1W22B-7]
MRERTPADLRIDSAHFHPQMLYELARAVADLGQDPARICMGLGLTVEDLEDPHCRVSYRQANLLIHRAIQLFPGVGLGLESGRRNTLGTIGILGLAMSLSRTMQDAIGLYLKYEVLSGGIVNTSVELEGANVVFVHALRFPAPEIEIFLIEEAFSSAVQFGRGLMGPDFRILQVEFSYPAPSYVATYEPIFQAPLRFGCRQSRVVMPASLLEYRLPLHNPLTLKQAMQVVQAETAAYSVKEDLCQSVETAIYKALKEGPRIEAISGQLNMSSRTLRRRLADSNIAFEDLLDNARKTRALSLLTHSDLPVDDIAVEIGYNNPSNFRRAFRRWTGVAPTFYRSDAQG